MPHLDNPYRDTDAGVWTKGTLHAHGPHTGGKLSHQDMLDLLAAQGYGFAMIVEHDALIDLKEFDGLDQKGIVLMRGYELTRGPHLLHAGATSVIEDQTNTQEALIMALAQGGLVIAAHPNFGDQFDHIPVSDMKSWRGLHGIEIYNPLIHRTKGSPWALDKWDQLLTAGRGTWGFADDDAFVREDVGRAFIVVHTDAKPTQASIIDSLRVGRFFASSGLWFDRIEADGLTARVRAPRAKRIAAFGAGAMQLASVRGDTMELTVAPGVQYVRFEAAGEPDEFAWTQPLFVAGVSRASG